MQFPTHTVGKVLPVSPGFSLVASFCVSVLCHSVHIHLSNAHTLAQHCMRAYSSPHSVATLTTQSMAGQSYRFQFLYAFLQLPFIIMSILYDLSSAIKTRSSSSISSSSSSSPFLPIDSVRHAYISCSHNRRRSYTIQM